MDDVVEGHLLAMEKGRVGERYLLGGENVSLKGLFSLVDEVTNRKHFQVSLPRSLALLYAGLEKRKAEWLGVYPKVTPGWVETFLADWAFTSAKAESELGYRITPLSGGDPPDARLAARQRAADDVAETTGRPDGHDGTAVRPRPAGVASTGRRRSSCWR